MSLLRGSLTKPWEETAKQQNGSFYHASPKCQLYLLFTFSSNTMIYLLQASSHASHPPLTARRLTIPFAATCSVNLAIHHRASPDTFCGA